MLPCKSAKIVLFNLLNYIYSLTSEEEMVCLKLTQDESVLNLNIFKYLLENQDDHTLNYSRNPFALISEISQTKNSTLI